MIMHQGQTVFQLITCEYQTLFSYGYEFNPVDPTLDVKNSSSSADGASDSLPGECSDEYLYWIPAIDIFGEDGLNVRMVGDGVRLEEGTIQGPHSAQPLFALLCLLSAGSRRTMIKRETQSLLQVFIESSIKDSCVPDFVH